MQATNSTWDALTARPNWAHEFVIAIGGWPTLYSLHGTGYTLATVTATSDDLSQFTGISNILLEPPTGAGQTSKGRPEEGGQTIASLKVTLGEKRSSGKLVGSDLVSRAAYLFGNTGTTHTTTLSGDHASDATTITVASTSGFASSGVVYIGLECIHYTGKTSTTFTGCTRSYRLTNATKHLDGVTVYDFLPTLYRMPVYAFHGYQGMTSTATFVRSFSGIVTGDQKVGPTIDLTCAANTWELYALRSKKICQKVQQQAVVAGYVLGGSAGDAHVGTGDYRLVIGTPQTISALGDGHHMVNLQGEWCGIKSATGPNPVDPTLGYTYVCTLTRALGQQGHFDHPMLSGDALPMGWSNVDFSSMPPAGDEVPKLILKLLLSNTGDGSNDATYDVYESGVGLAIPAARVDQDSFNTILNATDYDSNQRVFFVFTEPVDAKQFIEEELCRPFGYSLITGNDGKIKLIRHRDPQHAYINRVNRRVGFRPAEAHNDYNYFIPSGVYNPADLATAVQTGLNAMSSGGFTVTYSTTTNKFTIANASAFNLADSPGLREMGFTSFATGTTSTTSNNAVFGLAAFPQVNGSAPQLTMADVLNLSVVDSRDWQIASVVYKSNYDFENDVFRLQREYIDAETVNLGDELGARQYLIEAKGLYAGADNSTTNVLTPGNVVTAPNFFHAREACTGCCEGDLVTADPTYAYDADDSWAKLFSQSLLYRYKQPPLVLKLRVPWKWAALEIGDFFKLSYANANVVVDEERGLETLSSRNFEIASRVVNKDATIDWTVVGYRYQGFA